MQATISGTHVAGLWGGLVEAAKKLAAPRESASIREVLAPGLLAMLHVGLYSPRFGSPKREQLLNPAAGIAVQRAIERHLPRAMCASDALRCYLMPLLGITKIPRFEQDDAD